MISILIFTAGASLGACLGLVVSALCRASASADRETLMGSRGFGAKI